jgi:biopolymer transport protein ExbB/TolQ
MEQGSMMELLIKFLMVAGMFASVTLMSFFFWSAWFIPIVKKLRIDEQKKKLLEEEHKIEIMKANSVLVVEEKRAELDEVIKKKMDEELEYQKLKRKNAKIVESLEAIEKLEADKAKKNATTNSKPLKEKA